MELWELFMIAVGLAMDAFAVSLSNGMAIPNLRLRDALKFGFFFGLFQALMPLIGWAAGHLFSSYITAFDHWIAFALLGYIGAKMIYDVIRGGDEEAQGSTQFSILIVLAVATSIDALAVGISLAMAGNVNILTAVLLIGVITFTLSAAGVKIGNVFGSRFEKKAQTAGGVILVLLGLKILLEHLGVLG